MAVKTRRQYAGGAAATTIGGSLASAGVTTFSISSVTGWPASTTIPFYVVVSPQTSSEEKMLITLNGTTATVVSRGVDGTTANTHASGAAIYPVVTAVDLDEANELAAAYAHSGTIVYQGASTFTELTIGSTDQVLKVASGAPTWGQVNTGSIADSAITSAKIADATIVASDIAVSFKKLVCPVGTISAYSGVTAPTGWLLCDGSSIDVSYTDLIALVGSTTPDMRGRFPIGDNSTLNLLGTGGSTTIGTTNLPAHSHANTATASTSVTLTDPGHNHSQNPHNHTQDPHDHDISVTTQSAITSHTHNNLYDYVAAGTNGWATSTSTNSIASSTATNQSTTATNNSSTTGITVASASTTVIMTNADTGGGQAYYPPYLVVNYIIKHDY